MDGQMALEPTRLYTVVWSLSPGTAHGVGSYAPAAHQEAEAQSTRQPGRWEVSLVGALVAVYEHGVLTREGRQHMDA